MAWADLRRPDALFDGGLCDCNRRILTFKQNSSRLLLPQLDSNRLPKGQASRYKCHVVQGVARRTRPLSGLLNIDPPAAWGVGVSGRLLPGLAFLIWLVSSTQVWADSPAPPGAVVQVQQAKGVAGAAGEGEAEGWAEALRRSVDNTRPRVVPPVKPTPVVEESSSPLLAAGLAGLIALLAVALGIWMGRQMQVQKKEDNSGRLDLDVLAIQDLPGGGRALLLELEGQRYIMMPGGGPAGSPALVRLDPREKDSATLGDLVRRLTLAQRRISVDMTPPPARLGQSADADLDVLLEELAAKVRDLQPPPAHGS